MSYEKLYLSKSKNEFIPEDTAVKLYQHQREGVRFLYEQYAKNKHGIIINDPCRSGRSLQVLLFLHAIKDTVSEPVLVLTELVEAWRELIFAWTESSHEVCFQSTLSMPHKKIYINSVGDISSLKRQKWSVLVVDHEECSGKLMKQLSVMQAGYKVVVTAVDLKENIKTFASIYEWLNPAGRFNVTLFAGGEREHEREQCRKQLAQRERYKLLDCYFEGIVLRRPDVMMFTNDEPKQPIAPPSPQKGTKKNKDITGTKIKRTKRKVEPETESASTSNPIQQNIEPKDFTANDDVEAMDYKDNAADMKRNNDMDLAVVTNIPKKRVRLISDEFDDDIEIIEGEIKSVDIRDANEPNQNCDRDKSKIEEKKTGRLQTRYAIDVGAFISSQKPEPKRLYTDNNRIKIESVNTSNEFQCKVKLADETNKAEDEDLQKDNQMKVEEITSSAFDDKMKALQEKTQMKFKGSLLDSIF